jgi:hypothetical protein
MNASMVRRGILFLVAALTACATNGDLDQVGESGFLSDYSMLSKTKNTQGKLVRAWASPKFTPANYDAILVEPLVLHPEPQPTEHVSAEELQRILDYSNDVLRRSLDGRFKLVERAGPGVVRLRTAFSGVAAKGESLQPYQYVPIAFVVTMTSRAVAGKPQRAFILAEVEGTDSVTGELLGQRIRVGTGERLKKIDGTTAVSLETLQPLLDELAGQAFPELEKHVKREL